MIFRKKFKVIIDNFKKEFREKIGVRG